MAEPGGTKPRFSRVLLRSLRSREKIIAMAYKTPKLVVDRYSKVLWELAEYTAAILALVWCAAYFMGIILNPGHQVNDFISPWIDALFVWFVWKDPPVVLAVVVPLAIALQVAVHGLRSDMASNFDTDRPPRVREQELERIRMFSRIAVVTASLIAIFTVFTVLSGLLGGAGERNEAMSATVAFCGLVTATLCLDAARVATTQDLEQRLVTAVAWQQKWKQRLQRVRRDVPSRRRSWAIALVLIFFVVIIPVALSDYRNQDGLTIPPGVEGVIPRVGVCIALIIVLAVFLLLNFIALLIVAVIPNISLLFRIVTLVVFITPTSMILIGSIISSSQTGPLMRVTVGLFPTITLISMLYAWFQITRISSGPVTRFSFGFHTLLRLWAFGVVLHWYRVSNDNVSWLSHSLHVPAVDSATQNLDEPAHGRRGALPRLLTDLFRR
ncbi:hypothetical protein [Paenarthrobacter sp. NPDC058040]|uniref:hypothetical protein n=1 Tax=unclassified Paenarthrobacter TaxID=2634190 RepID=UPI0036DF62E6